MQLLAEDQGQGSRQFLYIITASLLHPHLSPLTSLVLLFLLGHPGGSRSYHWTRYPSILETDINETVGTAEQYNTTLAEGSSDYSEKPGSSFVTSSLCTKLARYSFRGTLEMDVWGMSSSRQLCGVERARPNFWVVIVGSKIIVPQRERLQVIKPSRSLGTRSITTGDHKNLGNRHPI